MKYDIHLFNFYGTPVSIRPLFFLLFLFASPTFVISIFIAAIIHELAHTRVAQKLGHEVKSVYLDLLNGAADIDLTKTTTIESIKIVLAGPLSNLLLFLTSIILTHIGVEYPTLISQFLKDFQIINLILFLFNLIPIFPMDGGRIFRDIIVLITGKKKLSVEIGSFVSILISMSIAIFFSFSTNFIIVAFMIFLCALNGILWYGEVKDIK